MFVLPEFVLQKTDSTLLVPFADGEFSISTSDDNGFWEEGREYFVEIISVEGDKNVCAS